MFQENPNMYSYEYTDGRIVTLFQDGFQSVGGVVYPPGIVLSSYPEFGGDNELSIDDLILELSISLSNNFSNFKSCKPYVMAQNIIAYCNDYDSEPANLILDNNSSTYLYQHQDLSLIHI